MKDVELRVNIDAKFDWLNPPNSTTDRVLREQSDIRVKEMASKLELAVKLIISEMLNMGTEQ